MKPPVPFNVYVQALGGKFLGPNAYTSKNSVITLKLEYSMGSIPITYTVTPNVTNDGTISTNFTDGSTSFLPILTMPESGTAAPGVNYLTPDSNTIVGKTNIFLPNANEVAMLHVSIPTPSGAPLLFTQPVLLNPQQVVYNVSVVIPGLLLTPNKSTAVPAENISVFVAMMCGCKVTINKPTSYWTYTDFSVSARVTYKDKTEEQVELAFDPAVNLSLFTGPVKNIDNIDHINFAAQQKSTNNYGALLQKF